MPPKGPTQRTIVRLSGRWFTSTGRLDRYDGRIDDKDKWTEVGVYKCRVNPVGIQTSDPLQASQNFDSEVILVTPPVVGTGVSFVRSGRYRIKVEEYKSALEAGAVGGPPEVKRTTWLEASRVNVLPSADGGELFAVLACRNAKPWGSLT